MKELQKSGEIAKNIICGEILVFQDGSKTQPGTQAKSIEAIPGDKPQT